MVPWGRAARLAPSRSWRLNSRRPVVSRPTQRPSSTATAPHTCPAASAMRNIGSRKDTAGSPHWLDLVAGDGWWSRQARPVALVAARAGALVVSGVGDGGDRGVA